MPILIFGDSAKHSVGDDWAKWLTRNSPQPPPPAPRANAAGQLAQFAFHLKGEPVDGGQWTDIGAEVNGTLEVPAITAPPRPAMKSKASTDGFYSSGGREGQTENPEDEVPAIRSRPPSLALLWAMAQEEKKKKKKQSD
ncbi:hypothetical protein MPTK1_6g08480 [Marchantia polymorpha subsp. ruderalis]|uniref:Uncharacterized protein n=2 Tax=Marchantia polymorpha TaxID=3197 RepID=A0AAF6BPX0_MARPO|nr:hypothetical protein MARPO_0060s0073 [Marchantia polymorpha]BBN14054.1 hypothetical protein Mp_6g08480 [Marchantia polymorpha subsp. ruderalis]|eukprot:PTQ36991.1 hypothetical protein MARPO_0060s0073 [Marchantia polymorpha]